MISQKGDKKWPHYIVETLHSVYSTESNNRRHEFNEAIKNYARKVNVDIFDNSQLSRLLESYDGRTYGMKFQMLKANLLIHYFHNVVSC